MYAVDLNRKNKRKKKTMDVDRKDAINRYEIRPHSNRMNSQFLASPLLAFCNICCSFYAFGIYNYNIVFDALRQKQSQSQIQSQIQSQGQYHLKCRSAFVTHMHMHMHVHSVGFSHAIFLLVFNILPCLQCMRAYT